MEPEPRQPLARFLALNRTVAIVLITVFLFGLGEELWARFMPVLLKAQTKDTAQEAAAAGAIPTLALWLVGLYAFFLNLFEGVCYIGGGRLTARLGDRGGDLFRLPRLAHRDRAAALGAKRPTAGAVERGGPGAVAHQPEGLCRDAGR